MTNKLNAHNGPEEQRENEDKSLVVAPTSHIITPNEMYGLEGLEREDITLPRVKLLQSMSDEVSNGSALAGDWLNTLSGQSYGTNFEFVPVSVWKSRTLFSEDRSESPICRSADGRISIDGFHCASECPHDAREWQGSIPPRCTEGYNYLIIPTIEQFPAIVSLMKTSFKTGKALNTLLMAARCSAWFWEYEFYSVKQSNSRGTFYVAGVRKKIADGKPVASNDEMRQMAEQFYRMAKSGKITFDEDDNEAR